MNDLINLPNDYYNLALNYQLQDKTDLSEEYYLKAFRLLETMDNEPLLNTVSAGLSKLLMDKGRFDFANSVLMKAIDSWVSLTPNRYKLICVLSLIESKIKEGCYKEALETLKKYEIFVGHIEDDSFKSDFYNKYSIVYEHFKSFENAFVMLKQQLFFMNKHLIKIRNDEAIRTIH